MLEASLQSEPGAGEHAGNSHHLIEQASQRFPEVLGGDQGALRVQLEIAAALVKENISVLLEFTSYFLFLTCALYGFIHRFQSRNSFGYFAYFLVLEQPFGAIYDYAMKNKNRYVGFPASQSVGSMKYLVDLMIHEGLYIFLCLAGHLFNAIVGDEKWLSTFLCFVGHISYMTGRIPLPQTEPVQKKGRAAERMVGDTTATAEITNEETVAEEQEVTTSELTEEHEETMLGESNISESGI